MEVVQKKRDEISAIQRQRVIDFLRSRGILGPDKTSWVITFDDDEKTAIDLVDLFFEFMNVDSNLPFMDIVEMVKQFHTTYDIPIQDNPACIAPKEGAVRLNLMWEEAKETQDANRNEDLIEVFDGLGDQLYILAGTILKFGCQDIIIKGFRVIHDSNMTKLDPEGKPIYRHGDGKVLKGPFYKPPTEDLKSIIETHYISADGEIS